MTESTVYIGIGSNLGDRAGNCKKAAKLLGEAGEVKSVSPLYESAAWGVVDQPSFINGVVELRTKVSPEELLSELKSIEIKMGRVKSSVRYGPRLIDLDIIFFGDEVVVSSELAVPHPLMHKRAFVLVPLSDIAPDFIHPVLLKSVRELLKALSAPEREGVESVNLL